MGVIRGSYLLNLGTFVGLELSKPNQVSLSFGHCQGGNSGIGKQTGLPGRIPELPGVLVVLKRSFEVSDTGVGSLDEIQLLHAGGVGDGKDDRAFFIRRCCPWSHALGQ